MFAMADGPPGVAVAHLSSQERGLRGVHTGCPERSVVIDKLQVCLAADVRAHALVLVNSKLAKGSVFGEDALRHRYACSIYICST